MTGCPGSCFLLGNVLEKCDLSDITFLVAVKATTDSAAACAVDG
jgi:hypothetical protein